MILYTSDINTNQRKTAKTAFIYLLISLLLALFGAVYELFSHEVYSFYMIYAFSFPLAGGTLPFAAISLFVEKKTPNAVSQNLYHSGIAALTIGSILQGVLDIYGTTNRWIRVYWLVGIGLLVAGIVMYLLQIFLYGGKWEN